MPSTPPHTVSILTFITICGGNKYLLPPMCIIPHAHAHTCVIHSYNTMNRASLLCLSLCVWVTVQILPVIRELSLKQTPSLPPAFQVKGNVRPNTHQGVLSLTLSSVSLSFFLPQTVGRGGFSVCRTPFSLQVTRSAFYNSEPSPFKNGGLGNLVQATVWLLHAENNAGERWHTTACTAACACVADTNAHLRAALIIATHGIQHSNLHCCRQHCFTLLYVHMLSEYRMACTKK